jgi:L-histidine N-alpha-methyltransferase
MISSIYFYDAKGSKLFEEITRLSEYYLTQTEIDLLKKAAPHICKNLQNVDIVEFGSGDGTKISILLKHLKEEYRETIGYIPFDVSVDAVKQSADTLRSKFPELRIHGIVADFNTQLDVIPKNRKKLFCFLGSTIGNLSLDEAKMFLIDLQRIMQSNDLLLIGFDMVKNRDILENAYNDHQKITEQFNKNILNVINNLVDTDFNPDTFEHVAFYNEKNSRIEMHLKATQDLKIVSHIIPTEIFIKKGETIHTENSYKFTENDIKLLAKQAELTIQTIFSDDNNWFSLVLFTKKEEEFV